MRVIAMVAAVLAALFLAACNRSSLATPPQFTIYKSPTCGCCAKWVDHLHASGYSSRIESVDDVNAVQERHGIPAALRSCHVAEAGPYLIVGHVPAADIKRLLEEQPKARGLAVPGMPVGSPGMEAGDRRDPYEVLLFDAEGRTRVYARHGGR